MRTAFEPYFSIRLIHDYYADSTYNGIELIPDAATVTAMNNHGLLMKRIAGGITVLFDKYHNGNNRNRIAIEKEDLRFRFILTLKDNSFYNYTDLALPAYTAHERRTLLQQLLSHKELIELHAAAHDITASAFNFTNSATQLWPCKDGYLLHADAYVSKRDLVNAPAAFEKKFGEINLQNNAGIKNICYIRFTSKRTCWRYILTSLNLSDLNNLMIVNDADEPIFNAPVRIQLQDKHVLTISSKQTLALSQRSQYRFRLVKDYDAATGRYKLVRSALPVPDIHHISNASYSMGDRMTAYSEIFL
jgi:hypothetical protein